MPRLQTWPEALAAYFDARRNVPFAWGTNDCSSFAAGAIEAMTGEAPPLPEYEGAAGAARELAVQPLRERVEELFGPEILPAFARRGDLILMLLEGRETLGVCDQDRIACAGTDGILLAPRSIAVAAWRV